LAADWLKTEAVRRQQEKVNLVVTTLLLAGLVCLLIAGAG
jgi:hypothetical protein